MASHLNEFAYVLLYYQMFYIYIDIDHIYMTSLLYVDVYELLMNLIDYIYIHIDRINMA